MRPAALAELPSDRLSQVFALLERVDRSTTVGQFAESTLEALGSVLGFRHTTYFAGPTYSSVFHDPDPLLIGERKPLIRDYRAHWHSHDVFAGSEAAELNRTHAVALDASEEVPAAHRGYVDWLASYGVECLTAIRVGPAGQQALFGIFGGRGTVDPVGLAVLRLAGRQLDVIARSLPPATTTAAASLNLAPRVLEVGELVSRGLPNALIAHTLNLTEDTVKKYVGRLLTATGARNRTELALILRS
ncbi:LuxR C-terminal-related transcriptional regulator [Pseudonocardia sp. NPDC049154]|uniref:helix-turn-helix transcriptional regulator n=1 Tax=Pseudonocardia sp. NPDC049154 TaxID=3155501 RepID=UPI0033C83B3E